MPEERASGIHAIDQLQKDGTLPVIPNPPILTSQKSGWNDIHLAHFCQPAWELPEFFILQHCITLVSSSQPVEVEFEVEGRVHKARYCHSEHSCIELFPANLPYKIRLLNEVAFTHFYLDPTFVSQVAYEKIDPDRVHILFEPKRADPVIFSICQALRANLDSDGVGDGFYGDSMAIALSAHLLRHYATRKHQLREYEDGLSTYKLKQAIEYFQEHLGEKLSLKEIALELRMSQYYFCRLFKQSTGVTPHQYLIQQRVERAKQLLRKPELTVTDIAIECGFANQSHFAKCFRHHTRLTPQQFRKI